MWTQGPGTGFMITSFRGGNNGEHGQHKIVPTLIDGKLLCQNHSECYAQEKSLSQPE